MIFGQMLWAMLIEVTIFFSSFLNSLNQLKIRQQLYKFIELIRTEMETMLTEFKFQQEEKRDQIRNHIANIKSKLSTALLDMKIGILKELAEQSMKSYEQVQEHVNSTSGPLANITNQTLNSISMSSTKVSRTDDGAYSRILFHFFHFV